MIYVSVINVTVYRCVIVIAVVTLSLKIIFADVLYATVRLNVIAIAAVTNFIWQLMESPNADFSLRIAVWRTIP